MGTKNVVRRGKREVIYETEKTAEALLSIENQLYGINAQTISLRWIGMKQMPTMGDMMQLNLMLGAIIKQMRVLRETGELDSRKVIDEYMEKHQIKDKKGA